MCSQRVRLWKSIDALVVIKGVDTWLVHGFGKPLPLNLNWDLSHLLPHPHIHPSASHCLFLEDFLFGGNKLLLLLHLEQRHPSHFLVVFCRDNLAFVSGTTWMHMSVEKDFDLQEIEAFSKVFVGLHCVMIISSSHPTCSSWASPRPTSEISIWACICTCHLASVGRN